MASDESSREPSAAGEPVLDVPPPPATPSEAPPARMQRLLRSALEFLDVAVLVVVMLICVQFVARNYIVDGPSMEPTFHDGEFVIVNRVVYRSFDFTWLPGVDDPWQPFGGPDAGDVVVFLQFSGTEGRLLIKRVIAVPGQTVEVRDGVVRVDDLPLDERYVTEPPSYEYPRTEVAPGTLFVLGDNRNNSADSHNFGTIPIDRVVGRADLRYWPIGEFGLIDHSPAGSGRPD